jgi:hypothetical protein
MKRTILLLLLFLTLGLHKSFSQEKLSFPDLFDSKTVQDIKITFPQSNWNYFLDSLRFNGNGLLEGIVEINGLKFEKAGVRYRGGKSFAPGMTRNPLNIVLNHGNSIQNYNGYKTLKLSNALRDPSMVREVLGYEIARSYMPAPRANFARVTVNGQYYGLMVNVEPVEEESFLTKHFGGTDKAVFKVNQDAGDKAIAGCKNKIFGSLEYDQSLTCYENNFEKLSEHGTKELIELTRILNEDPAKIETVLNVDNALWMLAFNNVVVNLSSYTGQHSVNYYLCQGNKGRFNPVVWDLNLSFGSFKNIGAGSDLNLRKLQELDPLLHADNLTKPLISKLLANEDYKKTYLSHVRSIVYDYFLSGKFEKRAKELQALIRTDFNNDPHKLYTLQEFDESLFKTIGKKSKIPGLMELMIKRAEFLKSHKALAVFPPDIMEVKVASREPLSAQRIDAFNITAKVDKFPKRVILTYRLDGKGEPMQIAMHDDGNHNDGTPNDGVFGVTVVPADGEQSIDYYIMAENAGLVSYSPPAYMWVKHSATLEGLNK